MSILKEELDALSKYGVLKTEMPEVITGGLNPAFPLRDYQKEALFRFIFYVTDYQEPIKPTQLLFHMATGSGKTLIMAAAILYLYQQGYRNFIFFVNSTNIIEKTKVNFLSPQSSKYLFAPALSVGAQRVSVQPVDNFQAANPHDINILFTTIQGLHSSLNTPRENALTYDDFEDKEIVLISDEAHHINAFTKSKSKRSKTEAENINTWEATVNRIFLANAENLLLEFTATAELSHPAVAQKYRDKILYQYSLKEFRVDGFSKEVKALQADLPPLDRALQTIVVSQYRRKVAESNKLRLKPVVLMKSRIIRESEEFERIFDQAITGLTEATLQKLKTAASTPIVQRAFAYFEDQDISLENLAQEIQVEFAPEKCLSVNSKSESEEKQLLVNSLEDPDNEIRVVFVVNMLNEGWDVLNLFDIVRLYDTRDAAGGRPGKTTIAEAQLIGRGARYFPFQLTPEQERYKRKYDEDLDNELRVLEELYYHSAHNPRYIQELHQALRETGIIPDHTPRQLRLTVKDSFKGSSFWENGLIFVNEPVRNDNAAVFGLQDALTPPRYNYTLRTGYMTETAILGDLKVEDIVGEETRTVTYALKDLGRHLLRAALARLNFYRFDNLKTYFPHLSSITDFLTSQHYLAQIEVDVTGTPAQLASLSTQARLSIALDVLGKLATAIKSGTATYIGTKEFSPKAIQHCVKDKTLNVYVKPNAQTGPGIGMRQTTDTRLHADLRAEDWYVYDENFGTSEEKALVKFIQNQIDTLRDRYTDIYLLRNQKLFQLYNFADGRAIEPDFVLFLTEKTTGKSLVCQLFIEPKGEHLIAHDQWKEDFLKQVEAEHRITVVFQNRDFKLVGLPFYNEQLKKREFRQKFETLLIRSDTKDQAAH